jgi:hypothetical protein
MLCFENFYILYLCTVGSEWPELFMNVFNEHLIDAAPKSKFEYTEETNKLSLE